MAVIFEQAAGVRLVSAQRWLSSWPEQFRGALEECALVFRSSRRSLAAVAQFQGDRLSPEVERRFDFWAVHSGGRQLLPSSPELRSLQQVPAGARDVVEAHLSPAQLLAALGKLWAEGDGGAPPPGPARLALDLGAPGTRATAESTPPGLFLASDLQPPMGDRFTLGLTVPGEPSPFEVDVRVGYVRAGKSLRSDQPPGYGLNFVSPPAALEPALQRHFAAVAKGHVPKPPASRVVTPVATAMSKPVAVPMLMPVAPVNAMAAERRASPRYRVNAPVKVVPKEAEGIPERVHLRYDTGEQLKEDFLQNLSQGGAMIRTPNPLPLHAPILLELNLPDGSALQAPGKVVHVLSDRMGVQFELDPASTEKLRALIDALSKRSLRALLVMDATAERTSLEEALRRRGFEVLYAANGYEARQRLVNELLLLDVVVVDETLSNGQGLALVHWIRSTGGESDLAVVLSARGPIPGAKDFPPHAVDAVIDLGLGGEAVALSIHQAIDRRRQGGPPRAG